MYGNETIRGIKMLGESTTIRRNGKIRSNEIIPG